MATPRIHRGLDWLNFFVADLQTGFGPFIAVFLTTHKWTQLDIGLALSVGSIASMASQVPAGLLVDAMRSKRLAAGIALAGICAAAALIGLLPQLAPVLLAQALHGAASCMLNRRSPPSPSAWWPAMRWPPGSAAMPASRRPARQPGRC